MIFRRHAKSGRQKGAALLITLFLLAIFAASLTALARFNAQDSFIQQARTSGEQAVVLARAARIYVRDQAAMRSAGFTAADLAVAPRLIDIATELRANGLIPANFMQVDAAGNYSNALGQRVFVFAANNPVDGAPTAVTTVPTAYVVIAPHANAAQAVKMERAMAIAAQKMKEMSLPVNAPVFSTDASGNAVTAVNCASLAGTFVASWDTGCLTQAQYNTLVASIPQLNPFRPGAMVIPAWRVASGDSRVLSRFQQPENPAATTMATDLKMTTGFAGTSTYDTSLCSKAQITELDASDNPQVADSPLCAAVDDLATVNNRFDILDVASLGAVSMIADRQATRAINDTTRPEVNKDGQPDNANYAAAEPTFALGGNLTLSSGDLLLTRRTATHMGASFTSSTGAAFTGYGANVQDALVASNPSATAIRVNGAVTTDRLSAQNLDTQSLRANVALSAGADPTDPEQTAYNLVVRSNLSPLSTGTPITLRPASAGTAEIIARQITQENATANLTAENANITSMTTAAGQTVPATMTVTGPGSSFTGFTDQALIIGNMGNTASSITTSTLNTIDPSNQARTIRVNGSGRTSLQEINVNICAGPDGVCPDRNPQTDPCDINPEAPSCP